MVKNDNSEQRKLLFFLQSRRDRLFHFHDNHVSLSDRPTIPEDRLKPKPDSIETSDTFFHFFIG